METVSIKLYTTFLYFITHIQIIQTWWKDPNSILFGKSYSFFE